MKKNTIVRTPQSERGKTDDKSKGKKNPKRAGRLIIGIDLGDRSSRYCCMEEDGQIVQQGSVASTKKELDRVLASLPRSRVAMEAGTHSPWVSRHIAQMGHEVIVANTRRVRLIAASNNKNDRLDAETLARLARVDPKMLFPIQHRSEQAQADLLTVRGRAGLVEARTALINAARGLSKSFGERLARCDARYVNKDLAKDLPEALRESIEPVLSQVASLSEAIRGYDERLEQIAKERYPEVELLRQVHGVGLLIALTFILTIDSQTRFGRSRDVGCYLGMRPRRRQSGKKDPELGISREGDTYLRKLLVQGAHVILGPRGADSDLRRFGERLASRGGKGAKKKARVAVARKLAILLHHLWVTGEVYEPLHASRRETFPAAA